MCSSDLLCTHISINSKADGLIYRPLDSSGMVTLFEARCRRCEATSAQIRCKILTTATKRKLGVEQTLRIYFKIERNLGCLDSTSYPAWKMHTTYRYASDQKGRQWEDFMDFLAHRRPQWSLEPDKQQDMQPDMQPDTAAQGLAQRFTRQISRLMLIFPSSDITLQKGSGQVS